MRHPSFKFTIPYYRLLELIDEGSGSLVYKAVAKDRTYPFLIIKILKRRVNSENRCHYLKQKIERLKIIHDPRVIVEQRFERYHNSQFIVRAFFPGIPLTHLLTSRQEQMPLTDFIDIAIELILALNAIHEAGIRHGGIKPNNIIIQPDTHTLRIVDFLNPIDIQEISHFIYDPQFIAGTLAYTSPEQTGRINHRVDFTTDIYSLGIVFYQLLTGQLPFTSTDPLKLIHSHLAEKALPIHQINPRVPEMLSKIVLKMCLKEPEKRYQTAMGLYADIQQCVKYCRQQKPVKPFVLGLRDHSRRVVFISKMVGRDKEAETILHEYSKLVSGQGFQSIFIAGLPGIGKTRLIQELQDPLIKHQGYFTSGKFDLYQKNIPYSSLIQAFRNLIRIFLTESDPQVEGWKTQILTALGKQGKVITDIVPELSILLGKQPDILPLPPVEARNRFNHLLGAFLASVSREGNPLVLFIDDLQWCDSATFDFLQYLFANSKDYPQVFFIGAYRNNEVDDTHPLSFLLETIQKRGQNPRQLAINSLNHSACHKMVAYILDLPIQQTKHLAVFLAELTEGNPLFVSESLSWLYSEKLLFFNHQGQWEWNMKKIHQSKMPTSVVEMFSLKVQRLANNTLEIVKICACIGNRFAIEDLTLIYEKGLLDLFESLKPALTLGLLIENKMEFQFIHDRVQEAVLQLISPEKRRQIHWKIGWQLLKDQAINADLEQQNNLFTIAAHLNLGCPEQIDRHTIEQLASINLYAGNRALNALATQAANEYYSHGLKYLPEQAWSEQYLLMYRLHQKLAKTELMLGRYEASEILLNQLLQHANDDLDRAEALADQTTSLSSIGDFIRAIDTANQGLSYFDRAIPEQDSVAKQRMTLLMQTIDAKYDNVWDIILNMPFTKERRDKIELIFYSELIPDLYMSGQVSKLYLSAAQSTLHCLKGGMDESVIYSFSIMGLNLGEQGRFDHAFRYQDLAHELCARYPDTFGTTRGINGIVWCNMHSRSHPEEIIDYCRQGIQCGKNCGDLYNSGLSYGPLMWNLQVQGTDFAVIEKVATECLEFSQKNQLSFSVGLAEAVQAGWIRPMLYPQSEPIPMDDKLALWHSKNHVASAGSYFVLRAISHYYFGRHREADACLTKVDDYLTGMTDNVLKRQWYVFRILNQLCDSNPSPQKIKVLQNQLQPLIDQLTTWAELGPLLKPYLALCQAEWSRYFDSNPAETLTLYLQAIETAYQQRYTFLAGFINELLSRWLLDRNWLSAKQYIQQAQKLYYDCGCQGKIVQLIETYPEFVKDCETKVLTVPGESHEVLLPDLDINYLIESSLIFSAEVDLNHLLPKIMQVVIEYSGASDGYLLRQTEQGLVQIAESHIDKNKQVSLATIPVKDIPEICQSIVNFVRRTETTLRLDNAQTSPEFGHLSEVSKLSLLSVLTIPLINQTKLTGILYLENRLTAAVFTPVHVRTIELLSQQIAISIQNARLLEEISQLNANLEKRVNDMTKRNREKDHILIQQSKLATMGEMINNIAHQWRQPLNALSLMLGNLRDAQQFNQLSVQYLDQQIANGLLYIDKMANTITDFRDFFNPHKKRQAFSIKQAVADAIALVKPSFKSHNVQIIENITQDEMIYGVINEYSQVLLNLLTNAKEAIAIQKKPGVINIELIICRKRAKLFVEDNGGGIEDEIMQHIFEPYFSTKEGGTGVGLYMSKMITETSLDGFIEVKNTQRGALFCINTPVFSKFTPSSQ